MAFKQLNEFKMKQDCFCDVVEKSVALFLSFYFQEKQASSMQETAHLPHTLIYDDS